MVTARTESWRPVVVQELDRANVPLPVDLILAVIDVESRGSAGLVNGKSGASGLMQIMPVVLQDFNKAHKTTYTMHDMARKDETGAMIQIRVGIWVLSQFWRGAYRYLTGRLETVPVERLAEIADLFYVAGPGATRRRLDKVEPPFLDSVISRYPDWNALPHPENVFKRTAAAGMVWPLPELSTWLKTAESKLSTAAGAGIGLLIMAATYLLLKKFG